MGQSSPFAVLQDIDERCRLNAKGLPSGIKVADDWVGIGFKLSGKKLVAKMNDVVEILPPPETIRVPGVLGWVRGLANVRGTLLPILDMNLYLSSPPTHEGKEHRILIINKKNVMAGLLVEEVFGLRRFKPDNRKKSIPSDMLFLQRYLDGVFTDDQDDWSIFNIEKLVNHEQFLKVV